MKVMEIIRNIGIFLAVVAGGYGIFRMIKGYFMHIEDNENHKKKSTGQTEYAQLLKQCTAAWNNLYALEPDKNERYRKAFGGSGKVTECMERCCEIISTRLSLVNRTEDMQMILYGSGLVYLENELKKLMESGKETTERMNPEEFEKYLQSRNIEVNENNPENGVKRLQQIYKDLQKDIEIEKENKARREKFVQIENRIRSGHLAELLETLKKPPADYTAQQYLAAAGEFSELLTELCAQCKMV